MRSGAATRELGRALRVGDDPGPQHLRPAREVEVPAGLPLDLAAGGLGDAAPREEDHREEVPARALRRRPGGWPGTLRPASRPATCSRSTSWAITSFSSPSTSDRESRPVLRPEGRVGRLHGPLDVLGIVVRPPDDDQVLEPARDEELAVLDEPQVSRPQERAFAGIRSVGPEGLARSPRAAASSLPPRQGPTTQISPTSSGAHRVSVSGRTMATLVVSKIRPQPTTVRTSISTAAWPRRPGCSSSAEAWRLSEDRLLGRTAGRDEQRRLGEPVGRAEGPPLEARRAEGLVECPHDLGIDRLGGVAGRSPVAKVEAGALIGGDPPDAEIVGEIGGLAMRAAITVRSPAARRPAA